MAVTILRLRDDVPGGTRAERADGTDNRGGGAVHQPDRRACRCRCHMMSSLPSPLNSPVPLICQPGPGLNGPTAPTNVAVVPSISQIETVPSSPCQTMSDLPSPLKSPVPLMCQVGPGLMDRRHRQTWRCAVHQPHRGSAIIALPDDVGLAVAVEVAGALDVPGRPRVRADGADKRGVGAVHQPHRRQCRCRPAR